MTNAIRLVQLACKSGASLERVWLFWHDARVLRSMGEFDRANRAEQFAEQTIASDVEFLLGTVTRPEARARWLRRELQEELEGLDTVATELIECGHLYGAPDVLDVARAVSAAMSRHMPCAEHTS